MADLPLTAAKFMIDPPDFVTFEIDSIGDKESILTLTNTSDNVLAFKVKISSKDKHRFTVQPSAAIVRRKTKIRFIMREDHVRQLVDNHRSSGGDTPGQSDKFASRFLLQILHLPPSFFDKISSQSEISASVENQWRTVSSQRLSRAKLRARFVFRDEALAIEDGSKQGRLG